MTEQIRALEELKEMAALYGDDISKPASSAREAVQWVYYGYLAAVKEQVGNTQGHKEHPRPCLALWHV